MPHRGRAGSFYYLPCSPGARGLVLARRLHRAPHRQRLLQRRRHRTPDRGHRRALRPWHARRRRRWLAARHRRLAQRAARRRAARVYIGRRRLPAPCRIAAYGSPAPVGPGSSDSFTIAGYGTTDERARCFRFVARSNPGGGRRPRAGRSGSPFAEASNAQRHCAGRRRVVLFLLVRMASPQQSERFRRIRRGPALCGGAKFGMVF